MEISVIITVVVIIGAIVFSEVSAKKKNLLRNQEHFQKYRCIQFNETSAYYYKLDERIEDIDEYFNSQVRWGRIVRVDSDGRLINIIKSDNDTIMSTIINFDDLISSKITENYANAKVSSLSIDITLRSIDVPFLDVQLLKFPVNKARREYKRGMEFAQNVNGALQSIIVSTISSERE